MRFLRKKSNESRQSTYSGSAKVFSYYANRSSAESSSRRQQSAQNRKTPRLFYLRNLPTVVATIIIAISAGYFLWLDTNPRIAIVSAEKLSIMQNDKIYQTAASNILSQSHLNRFKLTVDTDKIEQQMKSQFPELSEIVVTTPIAGHRLIFEIQPAMPAVALSSVNPGFIILDGRGRAVFKTSDGEQVKKLGVPLVIDESGVDIAVGDNVLTAENIRFITEVVRQLQAKDIVIENIILPQIVNELHIRPANQPYYVKFSILGDARLQAGAFIASKKKLEGEGKKPGQYIDVRTGEKVFYQ